MFNVRMSHGRMSAVTSHWNYNYFAFVTGRRAAEPATDDTTISTASQCCMSGPKEVTLCSFCIWRLTCLRLSSGLQFQQLKRGPARSRDRYSANYTYNSFKVIKLVVASRVTGGRWEDWTVNSAACHRPWWCCADRPASIVMTYLFRCSFDHTPRPSRKIISY